MDMNTLRIVVMLVSFAVFLGIVVYALLPSNRTRFEEAARVPFEDGDDLNFPQARGSKREERLSNV